MDQGQLDEKSTRPQEEFMTDKIALTISVPQAGREYFDMSRGASYEAAKRGDIPTVKVGRLLRVPVRALEAMLDNAGQKFTSGKR
jgi:hypothetical protein